MKRIPVRVIPTVGEAVMVEYEEKGVPQRRFIPKVEVQETDKGPRVPEDVLAAGVPYGLDWAKLIAKVPDPKDIEIALKNHGIWTLEDLGKNALGAYDAFLHVAEMSVAELRRAASKLGG